MWWWKVKSFDIDLQRSSTSVTKPRDFGKWDDACGLAVGVGATRRVAATSRMSVKDFFTTPFSNVRRHMFIPIAVNHDLGHQACITINRSPGAATTA